MAHIDRDKLLKDISESVVFSGRSGIPSAEVRGANKVIDRIKSAPAADVVEVKHGKWRKRGNEKTCSVCKFIYYSNNDEWNYCPNCGAKMDGERSETE